MICRKIGPKGLQEAQEGLRAQFKAGFIMQPGELIGVVDEHGVGV